ncbi:MAG: Fe-S-containing hydro-lyase [Nitrososphaerota archaeon]|nr:Fe-S-containing hydro-lyase [Nitrososphaerales archaeon]MDW8045525.1 Fe-S-containing hydro-lyase [Nitrososphaerota archaeon]
MKITTPLTDDIVRKLRVGDRVEISGIIYTARDAAHKRFMDTINKGEKLPFDPVGQIIYYVGPTPPKPGMVIGSAGPTSSYRMDVFLEPLLKLGLKGTIGKGYRSQAAIDAMVRYGAVYFVAIGGAGALISKRIKRAEVIAYEDLGTEAVMKLEVENFPVIVANDTLGNDIFKLGIQRYSKIKV